VTWRSDKTYTYIRDFATFSRTYLANNVRTIGRARRRRVVRYERVVRSRRFPFRHVTGIKSAFENRLGKMTKKKKKSAAEMFTIFKNHDLDHFTNVNSKRDGNETVRHLRVTSGFRNIIHLLKFTINEIISLVNIRQLLTSFQFFFLNNFRSSPKIVSRSRSRVTRIISFE